MKLKNIVAFCIALSLVSCVSAPTEVPTGIAKPTHTLLPPSATITPTPVPLPSSTPEAILFRIEKDGITVETSEKGIGINEGATELFRNYVVDAVTSLTMDKQSLMTLTSALERDFNSWSDVSAYIKEAGNTFDFSKVGGVRILQKAYLDGFSTFTGERSEPLPLDYPVNFNRLKIEILDFEAYHNKIATGQIDEKRFFKYSLSPIDKLGNIDAQHYVYVGLDFMDYVDSENKSWVIPLMRVVQNKEVNGYGFPKPGETVGSIGYLNRYLQVIVVGMRAYRNDFTDMILIGTDLNDPHGFHWQISLYQIFQKIGVNAFKDVPAEILKLER